ncbi:hypothetical protein IWX49DRAFT_54 [Phyllosticta citricarpa]|uniref:Uncharacterized protein n=1 Tax=Phyllosticta citricarpa TaxID=55181 RepID=A0ABR1MQE5_9PEZI
MTFVRLSSSSLRATTLGPAMRAAPRATMSTTPRRLAHQDYGSTDSSPKDATAQPASSATRSKEHPGAPAPDVGQNKESSNSSTKADKKQQGESSNTTTTNNNKDKAVKGARPKILDENSPAEVNEDVKQHNREMEQRHERADTRVANEEAGKDKVPPGYWSGR